ncbi:uroporphyrinogen-III synthase [Cardiobacteriaceae bacterium TAE3-ERU3]|nr:uroporphyrinogen-III synthase [Cardiobacteriaceae bacterium TAE3-ERU3]
MKHHLIYTRDTQDWQRFVSRYPALAQHSSHYPLLCIEEQALTPPDINFLKTADYLVFTSQHAVEHLVNQYTPSTEQYCIAIGQRTEAALSQSIPNTPIETAPPPYNSEALIESWWPDAKRIAIIGAPGGRTLLLESLGKRNHTQFISTYTRQCRQHHSQLPYQPDKFNIIMITSGSSLKCLVEITPQKKLKLLQYQAIMACISPRLAELARKSGFQQVFSASQANEDTLVSAIAAWRPPFSGTMEYINEQ